MATATVTETPTVSNLIVRYATLNGEPGYAMRTADRRVFFVNYGAEMTPLTNADSLALVLLGDVNTAEWQRVADMAAGGYAAVACSREMGVQ